MVVLRFLAGVFLLLAVIALVSDATRTMALSSLVVTSTIEHWQRIAPGSLAASQTYFGRGGLGLVWSFGIVPVLRLPAWLSLGCIGCLLAYAGRRRRRIGIFTN